MALIELNLEKPALKRVEATEETGADDQSVEIGSDTESMESMHSMETPSDAGIESESTDQTQSSGGGRTRRYGRRLALLGGTAAGVAAARKLRQRRKGSKQQELEEDWQTAE